MRQNMNREIKFRAWQKAHRVMLTDVHFDLMGSDLSKAAQDVGCELMQFTGLTDKNGKEIYEGDILSSEYPRENCVNCHPVIWRSGYWGVDHSINDCCRPWRGDLRGHCNSEKVIGNIYENPELLNSTVTSSLGPISKEEVENFAQDGDPNRTTV